MHFGYLNNALVFSLKTHPTGPNSPFRSPRPLQHFLQFLKLFGIQRFPQPREDFLVGGINRWFSTKKKGKTFDGRPPVSILFKNCVKMCWFSVLFFLKELYNISQGKMTPLPSYLSDMWALGFTHLACRSPGESQLLNLNLSFATSIR